MQYSTIYNNVAHRTFDTSSDGITRSKDLVNEAYQYIINVYDFSWMESRTAEFTITPLTTTNEYSLDSQVSKVYDMWYESDGRPIPIYQAKNVKEFNRKVVNDSDSNGSPGWFYPDYKAHKVMFDYYPSSSFISSYTTIYYTGRFDITELSADSDTPVLPSRLHRQLQEMAVIMRKLDKGLIGVQEAEIMKGQIINFLVNEDTMEDDGKISNNDNQEQVRLNFDYGVDFY